MEHTGSNITGRDGDIMAHALYCAIKRSQALPEHLRELSREFAMIELLTGRFPSLVEKMISDDEAALRDFPECRAAGTLDDLTDDEFDELMEFRRPPILARKAILDALHEDEFNGMDFIEDGSTPAPTPGKSEDERLSDLIGKVTNRLLADMNRRLPRS